MTCTQAFAAPSLGAPHNVAATYVLQPLRQPSFNRLQGHGWLPPATDDSRARHRALLQMALSAESQHADAGVHLARVAHLSEMLALLMDQHDGFARMLRDAAPLHDVGMLSVARHIVRSPDALTAPQRAEMQRHCVVGASLLGDRCSPLLKLAAEIAVSHHEHFDGTGYPFGLAGNDIPLSGRIVGLVDCFDALTSERAHRQAFTDEQALDMVCEESGNAFDPRLVEAFVTHARDLLALRDEIDARAGSLAETLG